MTDDGSTVFGPVVRGPQTSAELSRMPHPEPFESLTAPRKIEGEDRGEAQTRRGLAEVQCAPKLHRGLPHISCRSVAVVPWSTAGGLGSCPGDTVGGAPTRHRPAARRRLCSQGTLTILGGPAGLFSTPRRPSRHLRGVIVDDPYRKSASVKRSVQPLPRGSTWIVRSYCPTVRVPNWVSTMARATTRCGPRSR